MNVCYVCNFIKIGLWEVEYGNDFYFFFKIKYIRVLSFEIEKMILF